MVDFDTFSKSDFRAVSHGAKSKGMGENQKVQAKSKGLGQNQKV